MTQIRLVRKDGESTIETVVWLPSDKRLKKGNTLRLKGEQEWWMIDSVYSTQERNSIYQHWRVGGLDDRA